MKNALMIMTSALLLLLMIGSVFAYGGNGEGMRGKGFGKNQGGQTYTIYDDTQVNHQMEIDNYPVEELSQEEINGLLLMREEEKLARDVYLTLYDIWELRIFSNIAQSEQQHMDAVLSLIEKYDLNDPVKVDERGTFENEDLQKLYNQLIEQGSKSLEDALIVGATIEDLDIKDLQELNEVADNQDITTVYNNLEKGSRNHLRSFTKLIGRNGGSYDPQYISDEYYNTIISGEMETGKQYDSDDNIEQINKNSQNRDNLNRGSIQQNTQENSQNMFSKMWRGFKSWFN